MEKFLNLEINNILSESNKAEQRGTDVTSCKEEKIHNLQSNANRRGVKAGNFRVNFNLKGVPKKDVLLMISDAPEGHDEEYPHVLHKVLDNQGLVTVSDE